MDDQRFPSNSHKSKEKEGKEIKPIVTGKVIQQKQSIGKRFVESFVAEDAKNVGSYILTEVIVPAIKTLLEDTIVGMTGMTLWGHGSSHRGRGYGQSRNSSPYTSYNKISTFGRDPRDHGKQSQALVTSKIKPDFSDIFLESRGEAEEVIDHLCGLIEEFGIASVADLYQLVNLDHEFTDNKWGWTDLRSASVSRVRGAYLLNLPRPQPLN